MLCKLVEIAQKFNQKHILVTADMVIYAKAVQVVWNKPGILAGKVTMRLGGMHMILAYIGAIGKLYCDGGLLSLLVDSNVYAEATA